MRTLCPRVRSIERLNRLQTGTDCEHLTSGGRTVLFEELVTRATVETLPESVRRLAHCAALLAVSRLSRSGRPEVATHLVLVLQPARRFPRWRGRHRPAFQRGGPCSGESRDLVTRSRRRGPHRAPL